MSTTAVRPVCRAACIVGAFAACIALAAGATAAGTWTLGHGDIGVAYPGSGAEFEMEVHLGAGAVISGSTVPAGDGEAFEPGDVVLQVPLSANLRAIQSGSTAVWGGDATGYDFVTMGAGLGVAEGGNLWVLSFSDFDADYYGTPFLGWATEEGFTGQSFGNVTFTPYSFSGPGNMGVFEENLAPLWQLLAGDSSFAGDEFDVAPDDHVHKVLAFTQPGLYEVGIRATSLLDGTTTVLGEAVYSFQVVPEPSSVALAAAGGGILVALAVRRRRRHAGAGPEQNAG